MKPFSALLIAAIACTAVSATAQQPAPDKVALVAKGEIKEARASWWGFNAEDSTDALVKAISSKVPRLILDKMPSPWITAKPLSLPSNIEIIFEEGAELQAKRGCFKGLVDALVRIDKVHDVTLTGRGKKGATLKMHKADYHTDAYEKSEWRHCVTILSSTNVNIVNLTLKDSGGDGVYFGMSGKNPPTNIYMENVVCDGHNRQGLSVIAGVNCRVINCRFINTWGTAPAAGVDFEPNRPGEPISNFVMKNCHCENNQGCGYLLALPNMDATSGPMEITLEGCTSKNEGQNNFLLGTCNGPGYERQGHLILKGCIFENAPRPIEVNGTSANGFKTVFEDVIIRNVALDSPTRAPINFGYQANSEGTCGNFHFNNVRVFDKVDRPVFAFHNGGMEGGLENVSGKIVGYLNEKKTQEFVLTNEWATRNFPKKVFKKVAHLDVSNMTFQALTPNAPAPKADFDKIQVRGNGVWKVLAKKGDTLSVKIESVQLANYQSKGADVALTTPSGKTTKVGFVPFKTQKAFEVKNLTEDGLYSLTVYAGANMSRIVRSNLPIVVNMTPKATGFCGGTGYAYFYVPEGTKEFAAKFYGEGTEGLKVTIWGPDGKQVWAEDDISQLCQFDGEGEMAAKGGIFKIKLEKPTHLMTLEDYHIRLDGIPSYLGLAPELLIKPAK